jgi:uncharacterized Zn finger protein
MAWVNIKSFLNKEIEVSKTIYFNCPQCGEFINIVEGREKQCYCGAVYLIHIQVEIMKKVPVVIESVEVSDGHSIIPMA